MTSGGGNNFNDYPANQLNKFRANTAELIFKPHNKSALGWCVQSLFNKHFDAFRILTAFK